jgi:hypothetical protein
MKKQLLVLVAVLSLGNTAINAQTSPLASTSVGTPAITSFTSGMIRSEGFMTYYWDARKGKVWLEVDKFNTEFLYYPTLAQGVGSNDIGLDRGRLGQEHVVKFQRSGNKVLLVEPNYAYRALSSDPLERRAVEESFAQSVHAGFEVAAEEGGKVLVDLTPFLMQDAVGAVQAISQTKQGTYKFDALRSAMYMPRTKAFPQNTEFETIITLTGEGAGAYLREVVPTPAAVTMHQHHSFVQLPSLENSPYKPRLFDPRIGYGGIEFFDYASPVREPIMKRYISRHRLEKKNPSAAVSEAVKPIVYYLDPGTPEPIRSALLEGTAWWNQAFEAAGYKDAFQVKLLPADADPMDIRYNLIQWVHRSTRGWSYGASVIDPRTGEILKGKVTLGSLRVRQDYLIAQGLVGEFNAPVDPTAPDTSPMMQMSLDRLRQLAAHEVGHTLGLPHNYLASTQGRASVMDYPTMVANVKGASIDLSDAYAKGIGVYDKWSIRYGYEQFAAGADEKKELEKIITQMQAAGLSFLTDQDARPEGSVHPATHLWDNGANAIDELTRVMEVRKVALKNFSDKKIPAGMPMATLEEVFVPMYMFHRYQVESVAKILGGQLYTNALRGDGQPVQSLVPAAEQNRALTAMLATLDPAFLAVPSPVLAMIPPRPFRFDPNPREVFKRHTGMSFDAMAPPEASASLTLRMLLNPERCARLAVQKYRDPQLPGLSEMFDKLHGAIVKPSQLAKKDYYGEIAHMTERIYVDQLIRLAANKSADGSVRSAAHDALVRIGSGDSVATPGTRNSYVKWFIGQYLSDPDRTVSTPPMAAPDGAPIDPGQEWLSPDCDWK